MTKDHRINHFDWSPDELRGALEAAGVALWSWQVDTDDLLMDSHGYTLWDVSKVSPLTFERLSDKIHPADRDRVRAAFTATRAVVGPYEIDFRIIVGEGCTLDFRPRTRQRRGHQGSQDDGYFPGRDGPEKCRGKS